MSTVYPRQPYSAVLSYKKLILHFNPFKPKIPFFKKLFLQFKPFKPKIPLFIIILILQTGELRKPAVTLFKSKLLNM